MIHRNTSELPERFTVNVGESIYRIYTAQPAWMSQRAKPTDLPTWVRGAKLLMGLVEGVDFVKLRPRKLHAEIQYWVTEDTSRKLKDYAQNPKKFHANSQKSARRWREAKEVGWRLCDAQLVSCDRIDASLPYTLNNIVLCCHAANQIKQDLTLGVLLGLCKDILITHGH